MVPAKIGARYIFLVLFLAASPALAHICDSEGNLSALNNSWSHLTGRCDLLKRQATGKPAQGPVTVLCKIASDYAHSDFEPLKAFDELLSSLSGSRADLEAKHPRKRHTLPG